MERSKLAMEMFSKVRDIVFHLRKRRARRKIIEFNSKDYKEKQSLHNEKDLKERDPVRVKFESVEEARKLEAEERLRSVMGNADQQWRR